LFQSRKNKKDDFSEGNLLPTMSQQPPTPPVNVAHLVAAGYGVSKLRSAKVSPADIRAAGFPIEEMHKHLGMHMLKEAGFQLDDFMRANFPVNEVVSAYPLEDVLRSDPRRYPLEELMKYVPPARIRTAGNYTATEFLQLGDISAAELRQYGFTPEEISSALQIYLTANPPVIVPSSDQPPHAATMQVGDTWSTERTGDYTRFLRVTYTRLPAAEASRLLEHPSAGIRDKTDYGYDGSGKRCPRCGRLFVLLEKQAGADDMKAEETGKWVCDDPECGMMKTEDYKGYGSIFGALR
jgi:hypothetical protein